MMRVHRIAALPKLQYSQLHSSTIVKVSGNLFLFKQEFALTLLYCFVELMLFLFRSLAVSFINLHEEI